MRGDTLQKLDPSFYRIHFRQMLPTMTLKRNQWPHKKDKFFEKEKNLFLKLFLSTTFCPSGNSPQEKGPGNNINTI